MAYNVNKQVYLLALIDLLGRSYVQDLGLFMKRDPVAKLKDQGSLNLGPFKVGDSSSLFLTNCIFISPAMPCSTSTIVETRTRSGILFKMVFVVHCIVLGMMRLG